MLAHHLSTKRSKLVNYEEATNEYSITFPCTMDVPACVLRQTLLLSLPVSLTWESHVPDTSGCAEQEAVTIGIWDVAVRPSLPTRSNPGQDRPGYTRNACTTEATGALSAGL